MLMQRHSSALIVINLEENTLSNTASSESLLNNCDWLIKVAKSVDVPVISNCYTNMFFSKDLNEKNLTQLVIIGIEYNNEIVQTALKWQAAGLDVFVAEECLGTKKPKDRKLILKRLKQANITLVSREMVAFEWLRKANTHVFRYIHNTFIA